MGVDRVDMLVYPLVKCPVCPGLYSDRVTISMEVARGMDGGLTGLDTVARIPSCGHRVEGLGVTAEMLAQVQNFAENMHRHLFGGGTTEELFDPIPTRDDEDDWED